MKIYVVLSTLVLAAYGSDASREQASHSDEATAARSDNRRTDQSGVFMSARLNGTLYFNDVSPLEAPKAMALDLASGRFRVATDGIHPSVAYEYIAYVHLCSLLSAGRSVGAAGVA